MQPEVLASSADLQEYFPIRTSPCTLETCVWTGPGYTAPNAPPCWKGLRARWPQEGAAGDQRVPSAHCVLAMCCFRVYAGFPGAGRALLG